MKRKNMRELEHLGVMKDELEELETKGEQGQL